MTLYRVFLGRRIGTDGAVTDTDMSRFLSNTVTEKFPGFSVFDIKGYWRGTPEPTTMLEIAGEADDKPKVDSIATEYAKQFAQEAVMVTASPEQIEFLTAA